MCVCVWCWIVLSYNVPVPSACANENRLWGRQRAPTSVLRHSESLSLRTVPCAHSALRRAASGARGAPPASGLAGLRAPIMRSLPRRWRAWPAGASPPHWSSSITFSSRKWSAGASPPRMSSTPTFFINQGFDPQDKTKGGVVIGVWWVSRMMKTMVKTVKPGEIEIKGTSREIQLRQEGRLYILDLWCKLPAKLADSSPFIRQVAKALSIGNLSFP